MGSPNDITARYKRARSLRTYGCKCWALIPKAIRRKGQYKSVKGIFVGYFDDSKAYKVWVPRTHTILKARDVIFDESNHIERTTIHANDDNDTPYLWIKDSHVSITPSVPSNHGDEWTDDQELPLHVEDDEEAHVDTTEKEVGREKGKEREVTEELGSEDGGSIAPAPKDFKKGPWLDPNNQSYGRGMRRRAMYVEMSALAHGHTNLEDAETAFVVLADDEPANYHDATRSPNTERWRDSMNVEYETLMGYRTGTSSRDPPMSTSSEIDGYIGSKETTWDRSITTRLDSSLRVSHRSQD
jgi:hypothetical protein